jgi:hypothetical protein
MEKFGELVHLDLKDIWPNEAKDFTPWIAENIDKLGAALGMELELVKREASVGSFFLDILATDLGTNRPVVIENQLTETDHDHLGKLITYASGFDAGVVIWIARSMREEHRQALDWLNQVTNDGTDFFAIVVEVFKIDDSKPTFNFKTMVSPNEWTKTTKKSTGPQVVTEKMARYQEYFQRLIDRLRSEHQFTNARKGQPQSWYSFSSGMTQIYYGMAFSYGNKARVEVSIDLLDREKNKAIFDALEKDKSVIEEELGTELSWERLDDKRSCRVAMYREGSIEDNAQILEEIMEWSIRRLHDVRDKIGPRIKRLLQEPDKA